MGKVRYVKRKKKEKKTIYSDGKHKGKIMTQFKAYNIRSHHKKACLFQYKEM